MSDPQDVDSSTVYDTKPRPTLGRRAINIGLVAMAVAGLAVVVWYAYDKGVERGSGATVPLIRAKDQPVKTRPEKPGGMEVANRDKLVYDRMASRKAQDIVEKLTPPPEAPMVLPRRPAEVVPETVPEAPAIESPAAKATAVEAEASPAPKVAAPKIPEVPEVIEVEKRDAPETAALPAASVAESAPVAAKEAEPSPEKSEPVSAKAGGVRVQLAALRSRQAAEREWARLKKAHGDLLDPLTAVFRRVNLGSEKGIYFRLQAGSLADRQAAIGLCAKLKARKERCVIAQR